MNKLKVTTRDTKIDTDELRSSGDMPAVFYGRETDSTPVTVNRADFLKLWQSVGMSSVFQIKQEDKEDSQPALIQDVDLHPVTDQPMHADFYVIEEGQQVTVNVPLEVVGTAPAVKSQGGLLVSVLRRVEIEAQPDDLPEAIEVDVSDLEEIGDQATVGDITPPSGVSILTDDSEVVVLIEEPEELEEIEPEEEEEDMDFEDIEVEGEKEEEAEEEGEAVEGEDAAGPQEGSSADEGA